MDDICIWKLVPRLEGDSQVGRQQSSKAARLRMDCWRESRESPKKTKSGDMSSDQGPLVNCCIEGMKYYPVIWGLFHKPWNKDPILNNQDFMEMSTGFGSRCSPGVFMFSFKCSLLFWGRISKSIWLSFQIFRWVETANSNSSKTKNLSASNKLLLRISNRNWPWKDSVPFCHEMFNGRSNL